MEYVAENTKDLDLGRLPDTLTAQALADRFQVRRNTVSYYLNMGVEEQKLFKIETRPVYFIDRAVFRREHGLQVKKDAYRSVKELEGELAGRGPEPEPAGELDMEAFSCLIGYDKSLQALIRTVKASVLYPGNSLPFMIHGATGVGKSYLAKVVHQFCCDNGVIAKDAPFVLFNCAQYANNPELLSSKLFGHVKGAYTGAVSDSKGVIDEADGGILFLDEAHRLSKENQEKLFTFLDYGKFSRLGESGGWHTADVRIILATTERLESSFLETFRRRIPINIYIPALDERSTAEKEQMIYSFFISESQLLKREIRVPEYIFDVLLHHHYEANVGELQAAVKYLCASAYARSRGKDNITVSYWDFAEDFLKPGEDISSTKERLERQIVIREDSVPERLMESGNIRQALDNVLKNLVEIYSGLWPSVGVEEMDRAMIEQIVYFVSYFSREYFLAHQAQKGSMEETGLASMIARWLRDNHFLKKRDAGDAVSKTVACYLYFRYHNLRRLEDARSSQVMEVYRYCSGKFREEGALVREFTDYFRERLQISFNEVDELILILYLRRCGVQVDGNRVYPLLVGHGMATALSMAETANAVLGWRAFEAMDVLSGEDAEETCRRIEKRIHDREQYSSVLLLCDTEISDSAELYLERKLKMETLVIDRVSTGDLLDIGRLLAEGKKLPDISRELRESPGRRNTLFNRGEKQMPAIVCSCFSGIATAMRMENIIRESIPEGVELQIVSCSFGELKSEGAQHEVFRQYRVIGIVGTANPGIQGIPYVPLEDMIIQSENDTFKHMLESVATEEQMETILNELLCNFSVERLIDSLTILDTKKTIKNIENCILRYEKIARTSLTGRMKTCLYIHIGCLLERLIRQLPVDSFDGLEKFKEKHQREIHLIRQAFGGLEEIYHVEIPLEEIGYIYNILYDDDLAGR